MRGVRAMLLLLSAGSAALAAGHPAPGAQAQAPPAAAPPAVAPQPSPPPAPSPSPAAPRDIEDFVPSEKVSADDAVSFPADI